MPTKPPRPGAAREALPLSPQAVRAALDATLPPVDQHGEIVEHVADGNIRLRLPLRPEHTSATTWQGKSVQLVSGPLMLGLSDTVMYACALATFGADAIAVIQTMTVNFLAPAPPSDLVAEARIIRRGGRALFLDCMIRPANANTLLCHVTATYSIRHAKSFPAT